MSDIFVYDLISELRKNPRRKAEVLNAVDNVDSVSRQVAAGKATREQLTQAQADVIPASGFNFGLLIPTVFDRFPLDTPLDLSARPFMFAMTSMAPNCTVTLKAGRQVGKCADGDTEVTTNQGTMTLSDIFEQGVAA